MQWCGDPSEPMRSGYRTDRRMESAKFLTRSLMPTILLASSAAFAMDVPTGNNDLKLNLTVALLVRAAGSWDGDKPTAVGNAAPNGTFDTDFYIRRARLFATGSAYEHFTFFIMLDTPNFGNPRKLYWFRFCAGSAHWLRAGQGVDVEVGLLYMPVSHLAISSDRTSSIEKNTAILFYNNSLGLQETGAQVRALLFDRRILVRGGLYEGLHGDPQSSHPVTAGVNPNGRPLFAGMLRLNLIGDETG
jgi:hypothetical protein